MLSRLSRCTRNRQAHHEKQEDDPVVEARSWAVFIFAMSSGMFPFQHVSPEYEGSKERR